MLHSIESVTRISLRPDLLRGKEHCHRQGLGEVLIIDLHVVIQDEKHESDRGYDWPLGGNLVPLSEV
jgi:hypothetical protein